MSTFFCLSCLSLMELSETNHRKHFCDKIKANKVIQNTDFFARLNNEAQVLDIIIQGIHLISV